MIYLTFERLKNEDDGERIGFPSKEDLLNWILSKITKNGFGIVFLLSATRRDAGEDREILIFEKIYNLIQNISKLESDFTEIVLHEYESYEDAYSVALGIREENPLCFTKEQ